MHHQYHSVGADDEYQWINGWMKMSFMNKGINLIFGRADFYIYFANILFFQTEISKFKAWLMVVGTQSHYDVNLSWCWWWSSS